MQAQIAADERLAEQLQKDDLRQVIHEQQMVEDVQEQLMVEEQDESDVQEQQMVEETPTRVLRKRRGPRLTMPKKSKKPPSKFFVCFIFFTKYTNFLL